MTHTDQLQLELAEKESMLDLVALNNEGFVRAMRKAAVGLAARADGVTSDDLRAIADRYKVKPAHPNAWGSVFSPRTKLFKVIGHRPSAVKGNHGREIKVFGLR